MPLVFGQNYHVSLSRRKGSSYDDIIFFTYPHALSQPHQPLCLVPTRTHADNPEDGVWARICFLPANKSLLHQPIQANQPFHIQIQGFLNGIVDTQYLISTSVHANSYSTVPSLAQTNVMFVANSVDAYHFTITTSNTTTPVGVNTSLCASKVTGTDYIYWSFEPAPSTPLKSKVPSNHILSYNQPYSAKIDLYTSDDGTVVKSWVFPFSMYSEWKTICFDGDTSIVAAPKYPLFEFIPQMPNRHPHDPVRSGDKVQIRVQNDVHTVYYLYKVKLNGIYVMHLTSDPSKATSVYMWLRDYPGIQVPIQLEQPVRFTFSPSPSTISLKQEALMFMPYAEYYDKKVDDFGGKMCNLIKQNVPYNGTWRFYLPGTGKWHPPHPEPTPPPPSPVHPHGPTPTPPPPVPYVPSKQSFWSKWHTGIIIFIVVVIVGFALGYKSGQ